MTAFTEKPPGDGGMINGGFFVLSPRVLDLIEGDDSSLGKLADHPPRRHGADDGVRASRFLAADGHLARQDDVGRALGIGQGAMENLALTGAGARVLARQARAADGPHRLQRLVADAVAASAGRRGDRHQPAAADDAQPFYRGRSSARFATAIFAIFAMPRASPSSRRPRSREIVFHLAAQPLVRAELSRAARRHSKPMSWARRTCWRRCAASTTCARCGDGDDRQGLSRHATRAEPYREDDPLGGHDPYSASKAACEIVIASYRDAFLAAQGVAVASARAGNVIGGGDWSEDRLIPDAVRAWQAGQTLEVRRPQAVRPWQHVLEPLARLSDFGAAGCGSGRRWPAPIISGPMTGGAVAVRDVVELARATYGEGEVHYGSRRRRARTKSAWLALEAAKAESVLGVSPRWTLTEAVKPHDGVVSRSAGRARMRGACARRTFADFEARSGRRRRPLRLEVWPASDAL